MSENSNTTTELLETNESGIPIKDLVKQLRNSLTKDERSRLPPQDEEFLVRFVRGRRYDLERAYKSVQRYLSMKKRHCDLIKGVYPSKYADFYATKQASVLLNRDSKGRQILLVRTRKWDPDEICLFHALFSDYLLVEQMLTSRETQIKGLSVIVDLRGWSFYQARQFTPKIASLLMDVVQGTLPVSFQEVHFVNHPYLFNIVNAIARPFIQDKLRKRFNFHGDDMTSLHKFLSPEMLPESLGGKLTNEEALDDTITASLLARDEYYKEFIK